MDEKKIRAFLDALGFKTEANGVRTKSYSTGSSDYVITVNCNKESIDYGDDIILGDKTTSNFSQPENFVVLECVDRLLSKGYLPRHLTLEKRWSLGRTGKSGKADIVVRSHDSEKTLMIIECKTYGYEFEKEKERMKQNGGQLFSYFQQDKTTGFLVLYASHNVVGRMEYQNAIVPVFDSPVNRRAQAEKPDDCLTYEKAGNVPQLLEVWKNKYKSDKELFKDKGIFESNIEPYNPVFEPLRIKELNSFSKEGKVYADFMEILRHNNISDRSNAFNRFISLVLAKMMDESKSKEDVAEFQFKPGIDDAESLHERLQSLYVAAMRHYLNEELVNHTLESVRESIGNFPRQTTQDDLYRIFREIRLYSNNEFAFKEVYNKSLFEDNAKVLQEVVELLQTYRFRYDEKSKFLGEFFELMLENGYKQTEGQFFTPTPLARFIISALPLDDIIRRKIKQKGTDCLPRIVDFACGSGHFLTESIEALQNILKREPFCQESKLKDLAGHTRWARDYVWGVERDYRLARTSQVACFMHGDGDANIIYGDGLEKHPERGIEDGKFDILVANPPYSIAGFKEHSKAIPDDFQLWQTLTDASDDIEILFIERAMQLLSVGGMAGIILPSAILTNSGIMHIKAREVLLENFLFRAIVDLGGRAFAATGTKTVVLFLQKRSPEFAKNCDYIAKDFIIRNSRRKDDFIDSRELYTDFLKHCGLEGNIDISHWDLLQRTELFDEYQKKSPKGETEEQFKEHVLKEEERKFYHFMLMHYQPDPRNARRWVRQQTLIAFNNGTTESQEQFLGYKFSKRRGFEGLKTLVSGLLCDDSGTANDDKKLNYYVRRCFGGEYAMPSGTVGEYCNLANLADIVKLGRANFTNEIDIVPMSPGYVQPIIDSQHPIVKLGDYVNFSRKSKRDAKEGKDTGKHPFFTSSAMENKYTDTADYEELSVIIGDGGKSGIHIAEQFSASNHNFVLTTKEGLSPYYLYYWLKINFAILTNGLKGGNLQNIPKGYIEKIEIPLPPIATQKKVVAECTEIDGHVKSQNQEIADLQDQINQIISSEPELRKQKVGDILTLEYGISLPAEKRIRGEFPVYGANGIIGWHDKFEVKAPCIIVGRKGSVGEINWSDKNCSPIDTTFYVKLRNSNTELKVIFYLLKSLNLPSMKAGSGSGGINRNNIYSKEILIPALPAQKRLSDKITKLELHIGDLQQQVESADKRKEDVLKKYL